MSDLEHSPGVILISVWCVQVPLGGSERMKEFPALVPQEFKMKGRGYLEAAADIKLSSAGKQLKDNQ